MSKTDTPFDLPLAYQTQRHAGLPELLEDGPAVSGFEFISPKFFYAPLVGYMCWLALRYGGWLSASAVNPHLPNGGLWGESKTGVCDQFGPKLNALLAPFVTSRGADTAASTRALDTVTQMQAVGIGFPVVVKPDIGCRGAGVKLVENLDQLASYYESFPSHADAIAQQLVTWEAEAGVMFVRRPGQLRGELFSLTLKYQPYVTGDGKSTLAQLIDADPRARDLKHLYEHRHADKLNQVLPEGFSMRLSFSGSHCRGAVFRDGRELITPKMVDVFNELADDLPEFHFGRFDIRFKDIESFQRGEDFAIIELNGGGAEATHVWDARMGWREAYATLAEQYRLLWQIGWNNRKRGFSATPALEQIRMQLLEKRLTRGYPATD